uniref:Proteasome maturation protein n=1 Tax=Cyprinodon variegatus TaxID=28743 RepID=A0A3Q2DR39_CYPVA
MFSRREGLKCFISVCITEQPWTPLSAQRQCTCSRTVSTGGLWGAGLSAERVRNHELCSLYCSLFVQVFTLSAKKSRHIRLSLRCMLVVVTAFSPSLCDSFTSIKNELLPSHPLELSEKNFHLNQDKMNFSTLRNIQGLHAPLKLQMEYRAARQIQRLPFLPSSNLALDTLRGSDECIGFEDILCDPAQSEVMGEPHMMVEYKLGLL